MTRIALIALALVATSTAASAHDSSYWRGQRIDTREGNQAYRIEQARRSGQLTRHETRQLQLEQWRIRQLEASARRDGYISRNEARQIRNAQNAASRHIYQESHDGQVRRHRSW